MRSLAIALATLAALASGGPLEAKPRLTPEQELAKLLEGREAGKPTDCLTNWQTRDMRVIDGQAIVYGSGDTIWVNRPRGAEDLDSDDIMVTETFGGNLCRIDIVHTVDRTGYFPTGFVSLGEFVPYRRVPQVAQAD